MPQSETDQVHAILSSELYLGETVFFVSKAMGGVVEMGSTKGTGPFCVALTSKRILIVFQAGMVFGTYVSHSVLWDRFMEVKIANFLGNFTLSIEDTRFESQVIMSRSSELSEISRQIKKISTQISEMAENVPIIAATQSYPQSQPSSSSASDLTAQLAKLADLHRSGVLTDQEFSDAKRRLIGS